MKKIITLVLVSALGGVLTLGGYKLFIEKNNTVSQDKSALNSSTFIPTSNTTPYTNVNTAASFTDAAEKSIHAVVHVKNTATVNAPVSMMDFFYGRQSQRAQVGTGSGVIISPDGYIVTNNHVINNANEISITLNNNKTYIAELIGTDEATDIALLKIDTDSDEALPFITFANSDNVKIGDWVLAVGNPFNLNSTVTAGIISAKSRDLTGGQSFLQTDAAVNPGNSGGALVNIKGELVGINTGISSKTGSYIGYSFAVPSNITRKIVNDIMEYGNVQTGVLGVVGGALDSKFAKDLELDTTEGFYISEVQKNTGASDAGLQQGDVIKAIDNVKINKYSDLSGYLKTKNPNDIINVKIQRGDNYLTLPVTLTKKDAIVTNFLDIQFKDVNDKLRKQYPELENGGALIVKNKNNWFKNRLGFREGYIITAINNTTITGINDINALKNKYSEDDFIDSLKRIEYLDSNLNKKEIIFR